MASSPAEPWTKVSHIIPASHPRGYHRSVRDPQTSRLKLHVSQYILDCAPADPHAHAVTLILQHGLPPGDNAACFEPFLSDLLGMARVPVRSVWAMDAVSCGKSFALNREEIGDEHHWFDSARDVMQMVNHFQDEMRPPIIGIGQSWGVSVLLVAASWSPQLFWGLVGSDTVVVNAYPQWKEFGLKKSEGMKLNMAAGMYKRQRVWESREEVRRWWTEGKGKYAGKAYDPRALDKLIDNDYREREDGKVELATPPSQTVVYMVRPDPPITGIKEDARYAKRTEEMSFPAGFWVPWVGEIRGHMRNVSCSVLYLWASQNHLTTAKYRERLISDTGTGVSGGGGMEAGQIEDKEVEGGHSLPHFVPTRTAEAIAPWMRRLWSGWNEEQQRRMNEPQIDPERLPQEFEMKLSGKPVKL